MCVFLAVTLQSAFCAEEAPAEAREDNGGAEAARSYCNEETAGANGTSVFGGLHGREPAKRRDRVYTQVMDRINKQR